jgi:hypothetical protein
MVFIPLQCHLTCLLQPLLAGAADWGVAEDRACAGWRQGGATIKAAMCRKLYGNSAPLY